MFLLHKTYRIAGNFRGRKLSRISRFSRHPRKFSPRNSRHATPNMRPVLTFRESFLREMLLSYRSAKVFSLENFPLYGSSYTPMAQLLYGKENISRVTIITPQVSSKLSLHPLWSNHFPIVSKLDLMSCSTIMVARMLQGQQNHAS